MQLDSIQLKFIWLKKNRHDFLLVRKYQVCRIQSNIISDNICNQYNNFSCQFDFYKCPK